MFIMTIFYYYSFDSPFLFSHFLRLMFCFLVIIIAIIIIFTSTITIIFRLFLLL